LPAAKPNILSSFIGTPQEIELFGSGQNFRGCAEEGCDVVAMLNQDMTEYTAGYTFRNITPKSGMIITYADASLTSFRRRIVDAYTDTEAKDSKCGYACSDHASATRAGNSRAFVFEGEMQTAYRNIHTVNDTVLKVNLAHMVEHARLVMGFVVELAFAALWTAMGTFPLLKFSHP
jgi:leucyl aminopeptidase